MLNDLIQRYTPERPLDEKLKLLELAAASLPAPEFLWFPVAQQALTSPELPLRRAAMRLLAFAPQSWDQVLMTALTTSDADLQRAALAALATHAKAWPELVEAFASLGQLPGWLPESLQLWEQALARLQKEAPAATSEETAALRAQLASLSAERDQLKARLDSREAEHQRLQATVRAHAAEQEANEKRQAKLEADLDSERSRARDVAARLERLIASHDEEAARWRQEEAAFERLQKRHKQVLVSSAAVGALLVLVGGPTTWALSSQKVVAGPQAVAAAPALAPAQLEEELKAAEDAGYRRALSSLAQRADELEQAGHLYPAVTAWQAYAKLAPTPTEAQVGAQASEKLLSRIQKGTPADQFMQAEAKPVTEAKPEARVQPKPAPTQRPVRRVPTTAQTAVQAPAQAPRVAQPAPQAVRATAAPTPPALPTPDAVIPEDIRAKF